MSGRGAIVLATLIACRPNLGAEEALVTSTRILAVVADPPEARPGSLATYRGLVASPGGTEAAAPLVWRWCLAPKPLAENDVVSTACLAGPSLAPAGMGPRITAPTPGDACALFGPDTPPGGFRPRDPDGTGGYYQPLRVDLTGVAPTFMLARIRCNLANAPAEVAGAYANDYVPNANPHLLPLGVTIDGSPAALDAIPKGARVTLEASWPEGDAESYVYFDPASQALVTRREAMRVAWYASAGTFDAESTGRGEGDPSTTSTNAWTAPGSGTAYLWLVLRDSRGGGDFAEYQVNVRP
jgi:hypothetical protein